MPFGNPCKVEVFSVGILYLKSAVLLLNSKMSIGGILGLSNKVLYIVAAQNL